MKTRKSWREKMHNLNLPKLTPIPRHMRKRFATGTMLVPSPGDVEARMRTVRKGAVTTVSRIRELLAEKYLADVTCPLTAGIFVRIAAEAAEEEAHAGKLRITPYWRVLKGDGSLNPKFPGGVDRQAQKLRAEGHRILPGAGKRPPRVDGAATKPQGSADSACAL
jgi:hypothetical protein